MAKESSKLELMGGSGKPVYRDEGTPEVVNALRTLRGSGLVTGLSPLEELPPERCYVAVAFLERPDGEKDKKRVVISPAYESDSVVALIPDHRASDISVDVETGYLLFNVEGFHYALSSKRRG